MKSFNLTRTVVTLAALVWLLAGLLLIATLGASHGAQAQGPSPAYIPIRQYYLTKGEYDGSQILPMSRTLRGACASGYHFASLWEIFDTSNLKYEASLGYTREDSGFGPPAYVIGWIRTGFESATGTGPGVANCQAWTSNASTDNGTLVFLSSDWGTTAYPVYSISPWQAHTGFCYLPEKVWCVQD